MIILHGSETHHHQHIPAIILFITCRMMDRRSSWPWRKKLISSSTTSTSGTASQRKMPQVYLFTHNASFDLNNSTSNGASELSDSSSSSSSSSDHVHIMNKHEQEPSAQDALKVTLQAVSVKDRVIDEEERVRNLTEKLNLTLAELKIKQESFRQHSKVAVEALTGKRKIID